MRRLRGKVYAHNGTVYRSKLEVSVAEQLEDAGVKFDYEQYKLSYSLNIRNAECCSCGGDAVVQFHEYLPDFWIKGTDIVIEAKGRFTAADRKKILAVTETNPLVEVRMLFQIDQKLSKGRKKRYSDWCDDNDIRYSIGTIPEEWLHEFLEEQ